MTLFKFAYNNVMRDKKSYISYFINCAFAVIVFFLFSVLSYHPNVRGLDTNTSLGIMLMVGKFISLMFSFVFIIYSVSNFLKGRNKQFGLITILGASKKQLNKLIYLENIIIGFISIIVGIMGGFLLSGIFLNIASKMIKEIQFYYYLPIVPIIITLIVMGILFLIIAAIVPKTVRKKRIIMLLKDEQKGDSKVKIIPIIMLFVLLTFIILYVLLGTSESSKSLRDNTMMLFVYLAYILITTFIIVYTIISNKSKIEKKFGSYYKKTKMISSSNLESKKKSNTQSITITILLYAISFISIILLSSMNSDILTETKKITPYAVSYLTWEESDNKEKDLDFIESILKEKEGYKKLEFNFSHFKEISSRNSLISETEYNKIAEFLSREKVELKENESYVVATTESDKNIELNNQTNKELKDQGINLKNKGMIPNTIILSGTKQSIVIISDEDYEKIESKLEKEATYCYNIDNWEDITKEEGDKILKKTRSIVEKREASAISGYDYYISEKISRSMIFYVGSVLSFSFLIGVASLIYSHLYSSIQNEIKKYKKIVKIGLYKKELSSIKIKTVNNLMITPYIIALIYTWIVVIILNSKLMTSPIPIAISCTIVYTIVQILAIILVNKAYKKAIFKKVFIN